jgi:hypothetical protein
MSFLIGFRDHLSAMQRISAACLILALSFFPALAQARFHRPGPHEDPPPQREEVVRPRAGFIWVGGHHNWRARHYVWVPGHYQRERRGHEWRGGAWERHEDHYDWHRGGWHPVR